MKSLSLLLIHSSPHFIPCSLCMFIFLLFLMMEIRERERRRKMRRMRRSWNRFHLKEWERKEGKKKKEESIIVLFSLMNHESSSSLFFLFFMSRTNPSSLILAILSFSVSLSIVLSLSLSKKNREKEARKERMTIRILSLLALFPPWKCPFFFHRSSSFSHFFLSLFLFHSFLCLFPYIVSIASIEARNKIAKIRNQSGTLGDRKKTGMSARKR